MSVSSSLHPSPLFTSISLSLFLTPSALSLWPVLSLKYVTACRYTACLAGGGASPGQTEGAGGGAHRGEAQPAQVSAPEPPLPPDPGPAEVRPAPQRPGSPTSNMPIYILACDVALLSSLKLWLIKMNSTAP